MHIARLAVLTLVTFAALGLIALAPAHAQDTVFNSFGPGGPGKSFNPMSGHIETGPSSGFGTFSTAAGFSPSATGALSGVTVAFCYLFGPDDAHLYLTNSFSNLGNPGAALASFVFTPPVAFGNAGGIVKLSSARHPVLTAGQNYYLYGLETGGEANVWNDSSSPVTGTVAYSAGGEPYTSTTSAMPAFDVQESNPVPESSSLAAMALMLALGAGIMVVAVKKKKAAPPSA